jgi:hypothetical protein
MLGWRPVLFYKLLIYTQLENGNFKRLVSLLNCLLRYLNGHDYKPIIRELWSLSTLVLLYSIRLNRNVNLNFLLSALDLYGILHSLNLYLTSSENNVIKGTFLN